MPATLFQADVYYILFVLLYENRNKSPFIFIKNNFNTKMNTK